MCFARLVGGDDDRHAHPCAGLDKPLVDRADREDRGHGRLIAAIVEHDQLSVGCGGFIRETPAGVAQPFAIRERRVENHRIASELVHRGREEEEALQVEQARRARMLAVQRRARTEQRAQGHYRALAQMVDRRVRHLCEALAQERRHRPRTSRERRQRRVVTHRRHGLVTGRRRRAEEEEEILAREPDPHLARCQILRRRFDRHACVEGTHACA